MPASLHQPHLHQPHELDQLQRELSSAQEAQLEDETARGRETLAGHLRLAWPKIEPNKQLVWNWHLDCLCEHLEAVYWGQILQLLVEMPPRHGKSQTASVAFPSWIWSRPEQAGFRSIYGSYSDTLVTRDSQGTRDLITSDWYQRRFVRGRWHILDDHNRSDDFANSVGGMRMCVTPKGKGTGFGGDMIVVDDSLNAEDLYKRAVVEQTVRWINNTLSTRYNSPQNQRLVVIGQRLGGKDVLAALRGQGGYTVCSLRETFRYGKWNITPVKNRRTGEPWQDPRQAEGELLFPQGVKVGADGRDEPDQVPMWTPAALEPIRRKLTGRGWAAQFEQDPVLEEDVLFKRRFWRFWKHRHHAGDASETRPDGCYRGPAVELPDLQKMRVILSLDSNFGDDETAGKSSYVVLQAWGALGADRFRLGQQRGIWDFMETLRRIAWMLGRFPDAHERLIEKKANGATIINTLERKVSGIVAVLPTGSKFARASAVSPQVESGNVFLEDGAEDTEEFVDECERFPGGDNDDQVDAMSQALTHLEDDAFALERYLELCCE